MDLKKTSVFIREERKKLNLSQKELGKRLYVTDKAVSKWERGLAFPDVDTLKSLAVLFHCTVQNILDGDLRPTGEADHVRISQNSFLPGNVADSSGTEETADPEASCGDHSRKRVLVMTDEESDLTAVLAGCGTELTRVTMEEAADADLSVFDAYVIIADGKVLDPYLRVRLENENAKGKRIFTEALNSWAGIYSADPADTAHARLVVAVSGKSGIPGLEPGDLLDDQSNRMMQPWYSVPGMKVLLAYKDHVIAHRHWDAPPDEILSNSRPGLWTVGDNVMMCSFELHNFNRARFSPRRSWQRLISFIARWITGNYPREPFPEPVVRHRDGADLSDAAVFEQCRKDAVARGISWLERYLCNGGKGGVREGLKHDIKPNGVQMTADAVRTDCSGEAAGAFRFYAYTTGKTEFNDIADKLSDFVVGPMTVKGGLFDGMLRWTDTAWQVCYQDDAARAILPILYDCAFFGHKRRFPEVCRTLDFLVKTTAKDGCREARTDAPFLNEESFKHLSMAEHGLASAHYNAYYHAALIFAYTVGGDPVYLQTARKGLETVMKLYPETKREQSETEEQCRLILPLAALYGVTGEDKHRKMLYRVTDDLIAHKHPSGGFCEWDTGYKAVCSRESRGECSLLTENGDPIADLLYSTNWLPVGFAYAFHVTKDGKFRELWRDVAAFCLRSQVLSDDPATDGSWCRAFDMELNEIYGCPHDAGWAACSSESGWTNAEILMGLMMPELLKISAERE